MGKRLSQTGLLTTGRRLIAAFCLAVLGLTASLRSVAAAEASLPEYDVKALFLVNFTKYVEWPDAAWTSPSAPFVIGIAGENNFGDHLEKAVAGKMVAGRPIVVLHVDKEEQLPGCQILFVSSSEKKHLSDILNQVRTAPVLTVGEAEQFAQRGGVIGLIKKEGKIRLQIDLSAARRAGLRISSKLLNVADTVTGKS